MARQGASHGTQTHGWLNVGHHNLKMSEEGTCLGCDKPDKTNMRFFQYENEQTKATLGDTIEDAEKKLDKANVPRRVYKHFFNQYQQSCNLDKAQHTISCKEVKEAAQNQETLADKAIPRDFLSLQWTDAIDSLWKLKESQYRETPQSTIILLTKWEFYSTNQYGTYLKKYRHNVITSRTRLITMQVERN